MTAILIAELATVSVDILRFLHSIKALIIGLWICFGDIEAHCYSIKDFLMWPIRRTTNRTALAIEKNTRRKYYLPFLLVQSFNTPLRLQIEQVARHCPAHTNRNWRKVFLLISPGMVKLAVFVFAVLLIQYASAEGEVAMSEEVMYDSYRLPTAVTPENYKLNVITHLNDTEPFGFRGVVWITVRTIE